MPLDLLGYGGMVIAGAASSILVRLQIVCRLDVYDMFVLKTGQNLRNLCADL